MICLTFCSSIVDKSSLSSFFLNYLPSINHSYQSKLLSPSTFHYVQPAVDQSEWKRLFSRLNLDPKRVAGLRDYLDLVCTGKLYEELGQHCPLLNRSQLKEELFRTVFFGKTIQKAFKERFPLVADFIRLFKKKDYRHLAQSLQRLESKVVIHQICTAIHDVDPRIPILTIHDSVLTTSDRADKLEAILQSELNKLIIKPRYKMETYDQNLEVSRHVEPIRQEVFPQSEIKETIVY